MIFTPFASTDIVSGRVQAISEGVWSSGNPVAYTFYVLPSQLNYTGSSAFDVLNGAYYTNVYDIDPTLSGSSAQTQFSVTYGNVNGSGSITDLNAGSTLVTQTIYSQYRNILLDPGDSVFTFQQSGSAAPTGYNSSDIYVINFSQNSFKEQLNPGTIQFNLQGTNGTFSFIDDSFLNTNNVGTSGQVYTIVNGTLTGGLTTTFDSVGRGYGLFYPDLGIIVLNPAAITDLVGVSLSPNLNTDKYYQNQNLLVSALQSGGYFQATSTEFSPTSHYFVRVQNQSYNYTNNPTFVINSTGSNNGTILYPQFYNDPNVYITTVGLYDSNNELLAVAKLSQPLQKTFETEALIRILLSF